MIMRRDCITKRKVLENFVVDYVYDLELNKITQFHVYLNFQDKNMEDGEISCNFITVPLIQRYVEDGISEAAMLNTIASYTFEHAATGVCRVKDENRNIVAYISGNDFRKEIEFVQYAEKGIIKYSLYGHGFFDPVYCWNSPNFDICTKANVEPTFR